MKEVVVVSGSRTAVGNFGGGLKSVPVVELGSIVMRDVFRWAGLRPEKSDKMEAFAPDELKGKGLIELEQQYGGWDESLAPVAVDAAGTCYVAGMDGSVTALRYRQNTRSTPQGMWRE